MSRDYGYKHTEETKIKMSLAQKGRKLKKSNFEGKTHTEETKIKMSISSRKRWLRKEEKIKVSKQNSRFWRGGIYKGSSGYILTSGRYEHRIVMEAYLNRELTDKEVVHHIDGNRSNNKIKNLKLFKTQSEHLHYHKKDSNI